MATINLILDKRRARKDNTYPLVFRIRVKEKYFDIASGFTLQKEQFDSKTSSVKDDLLLNEQLLKMKMHYLTKLRAYIADNIDNTDLKEIKNHLIGKEVSTYTLQSFWEQIIDEMKSANRHGNARMYSMTLSVLSKETDLEIPIKSFNYQKLLALEKNLYKRGMSCNGIGVYMKTLRAVFNKAINYDIVGYEWYPFRKYKMRKEKTIPRTLSMKEMKSYFNLVLPPTHLYYRSWLIGKLIFILRGINIKDLLLLSFDNIKNGRIIYKRAKTGKVYSISYSDEVKEILQEFESNTTLLGIIKEEDFRNKEDLIKVIAQRRNVINAHLKKIGKMLEAKEPITTYVFRYSYANIAKRLGHSKDLIAEALGHEYGNSVTGIYLEQFDLEIVDEMNEQIVKQIMGERAL
jgi:integrase